MKILLVNPPFSRQEVNIWKIVSSCMPPLGLAIIASCLEKAGHEVNILDIAAEPMSQDKFKAFLRRNHFDWIGFTATTLALNNALALAEIAKHECPDSTIVFGGVHPSIFPEQVLGHKNVDYVIVGEGERSIVSLINGHDPQVVDGLYYKYQGEIRGNPVGPLVDYLDDLPFPAYHLLPMTKYHPALGGYKRLPAISMITSRGCPGACTFCFKQMFGNKTRFRTASSLISEIEFLKDNYGIREIVFYDDTFTANRNNVKEFCSLLISKHIDLYWSCMSRIDCIDESLLGIMKNAGCHQICYGVESACDHILKNIRKNISLDKVHKLKNLMRKAGISLRLSFMLGNPGESEETLTRTIALAIKLDPDIVQFNIATPYPGTEMYNWAKENNYLITTDWDKYDLSQPVMALPEAPADLVLKYYKLAYQLFYYRLRYMFRLLGRSINPRLLFTYLKAFAHLLRMMK